MKTPWKWIVLTALVIVVGSFLAYKVWFGWWEQTLAGPFMGAETSEKFDGRPVSSLNLPNGESLQVFRKSTSSDPVLCLKTAFGTNAWSRVLVPEQVTSDGKTNTGKIKKLQLKRCNSTGEGYRVYVSCDWDWGGSNEAGLIYLSQDRSFKGLALSW